MSTPAPLRRSRHFLTCKLGLYLFVTSTAGFAGFARAAEPATDTEQVKGFRGYIHDFQKIIGPNREGFAKALAGLKTLPFTSTEGLSPQTLSLATDLFNSWQPPACIEKATGELPALRIVGELHGCPNCQLDEERDLRESNLKLHSYAVESHDTDEKLSLKNFEFQSQIFLQKSKLNPANVNLMGLESGKVIGLSNAINIASAAEKVISRVPKSEMTAYSKDFNSKVMGSQDALIFDEVFTKVALGIVAGAESPFMKIFMMVMKRPPNNQAGVEKIERLQIQWKALEGSPQGTRAAFLQNFTKQMNYAEIRSFGVAFSRAYLLLQAEDIFDNINISADLKKETLLHLNRLIDAGKYEEALTLSESVLRSLALASNAVKLYCENSLAGKGDLSAFVGEAHARGMEYLFSRKLTNIPYKVDYLGTKYVPYTTEQTLENLNSFIEGK